MSLKKPRIEPKEFNVHLVLGMNPGSDHFDFHSSNDFDLLEPRANLVGVGRNQETASSYDKTT